MQTMTRTIATEIAVAGLQFIAGDTEQLSRFVSLSGIAPEDIRTMADQPEFLEAILDFFMNHEPTLLAFAASHNIDPEKIVAAKHTLTMHPSDPW